MRRYLPLLTGLAVLLAAGVVHGLWTDRWQHSAELEQAAARLADLPDEIGEWKGTAVEQDSDALAFAGAVGHWSRRFVREAGPGNTESVLVILMCGRPGRMAVHRPENCYEAAGFEMAGSALHCSLRPAGQPEAELRTALFRKDEADGPLRLRIFWTWSAGETWQAPENPRWAFARARALYKLYVLRAVAGEDEPLAEDPCVALLGQLVPELNRRLAP